MDAPRDCKLVKLSKFLKDIECTFLERPDNQYQQSSKALKKKVNNYFRSYSKTHFKSNIEFMNNFIYDKVLHEQSTGTSITYLILSSDESLFYAFFTLRLYALKLGLGEERTLDDDVVKKLVLNPKLNASDKIDSIPVHLIEEVAKNTSLINNPIHMPEIMNYALYIIRESQSIIGGRVVILNSVASDKVMSLYEQEGFVKFNDIVHSAYDKNAIYQPMYLKMSDKI